MRRDDEDHLTRQTPDNAPSKADELEALPDSELMQRIAARDKAAFQAIFQRFAGRVKSFMLRYSMPDDEAEEIAQEVMVQVWRKAESFDPTKAAASTWIFAIARNRRIDRIRRSARREPDLNDPMFHPDPEPDGSAAVSAQERQDIVREVLASLPEPQRLVLHATFFEGLSQAEIAEREGLPLGTVKSRVRLAFGRMRAGLPDRIAEELEDD